MKRLLVLFFVWVFFMMCICSFILIFGIWMLSSDLFTTDYVVKYIKIGFIGGVLIGCGSWPLLYKEIRHYNHLKFRK